MEQQQAFEVWAVVELFGHQKIAGRVTEQALAGTNFLRVEVPETERSGPYTRLFGAGAIYGITPCTEEQARAVLSRGWGFSHPEFTAKALPAPAPDPEGQDDPGGLDDEPADYDFAADDQAFDAAREREHRR